MSNALAIIEEAEDLQASDPEILLSKTDALPTHISDALDQYRGNYTFVVRFPAEESKARISAIIAAGRAAKGSTCWHMPDEAYETFDVMICTRLKPREEIDSHITTAREALAEIGLDVEVEFEVAPR